MLNGKDLENLGIEEKISSLFEDPSYMQIGLSNSDHVSKQPGDCVEAHWHSDTESFGACDQIPYCNNVSF
jgi:hypothetical protein